MFVILLLTGLRLGCDWLEPGRCKDAIEPVLQESRPCLEFHILICEYHPEADDGNCHVTSSLHSGVFPDK
jgi:hypothetical protein